MTNPLQYCGGRYLLQAALLLACLDASAADRRFVPVPNSDHQKLQVINGATIISAAGNGFHAGATIAPTSSKQAWLSVSIKNNGTVPVPFDDSNIKVSSADTLMSLASADAVLARQFQIELPKRSKSSPATLKVSVTLEGETIAFDFNELN